MDVQAPVLGGVIVTNASESDTFPEPAIELSEMHRAEDVPKEQQLAGCSSSENLTDDGDDNDDDEDNDDEYCQGDAN